MDQENTTITELIVSFFKEMNQWEKFCKKIEDDDSLKESEQEQKQKQRVQKIFLKYCTNKERKLGLPNYITYGLEGSYMYNDEEEKITKIDIETNNKAVVETERLKPIEESQKYVLKKVKGNWLIDSKKRYSWKEKWENVLL